MTRRKAPHEKLKPGPKPGSRQRVRQATAEQPAKLPAVQPRPGDFAQRHRNVALMDEAELRAYALQIGVVPRDAQSLPMDRLRQNCLLTLNERINDD